MTASNFEAALACVLREEGGYAAHPQDPGGPTNFGITIHDARRYWKSAATPADVQAMPLEVAKWIYRHKYWDAMRCDALPGGVDYCIFDYGVNSGTGRAPKVLRRVLGLPDDAPFDKVQAALRTADPSSRSVCDESTRIIDAICDERLRFLMKLKTWPTFGKGWSARVKRVRIAAQALAKRAPVEADVPASAPGKGQVPLDKNGQAATTGGAIVAGGTAVNEAARSGADALTLALIAAAAIAAAVGAYFFWRWRQKRRQEAKA